MTHPMTCENAPPVLPPSVTVAPAMKARTLPAMTTAPRSNPGGESSVQPMNALARLIHRRKIELDLTWKELADKGGFSSHTILYMLASKKTHKAPPRPETLERIARALDVPLDVVKQAAAEAAGYNVQEITVPLEASEDIRIIAAVAGELSDHDRAMLRNIAEQFAKQMREQRDS